MQNNAKLDKLYVKQSPHYLSKYHMPLDWINIHNNPECPSNFIEEGFCTCWNLYMLLKYYCSPVCAEYRL